MLQLRPNLDSGLAARIQPEFGSPKDGELLAAHGLDSRADLEPHKLTYGQGAERTE